MLFMFLRFETCYFCLQLSGFHQWNTPVPGDQLSWSETARKYFFIMAILLELYRFLSQTSVKSVSRAVSSPPGGIRIAWSLGVLFCVCASVYHSWMLIQQYLQYSVITDHGHGDVSIISNSYGYHYCDVIMGAMTSQITSLTIVCSIVHSGTDQRKHKIFESLVFVCEEFTGDRWIPRTKGQ